MKKVFISYYFDDATFKGEVEKWLKESDVEVLSTNKMDLTPEAKIIARERIKEQILESSLVLILVGNDTHNRPWVDYEVAAARSEQVPIVCIRLSKRDGAAPSEIRGLDCIQFNEEKIKQLIK